MNHNETFKEWISDYKALIFKVVRAYTNNDEDANDLFQDMAIQVWKSVPNFRKESAVSTWLYRIALNTAIRWSTKERRFNSNRTEISEKTMMIAYQSASTDDRLDWLYNQISRMNEIDKSLTLLLMDGFSYKEMADLIGISESNIGVKIHRIKKQLIEKSKTYDSHGV